MTKKLFFLLLLIPIAFFFFLPSLPSSLRKVPKSDNMVIMVKKIDIPRAPKAYNPSLLEEDNGFLLTYRYYENGASCIGVVSLDENLSIKSPPKKIPFKSPYVEDARIFLNRGDTYLVYNDLLSSKVRAMQLAKVKRDTWKIEEIYNLDQHIQSVEKNWVPFVYNDEIHFAYCLVPHKIFRFHNAPYDNLYPYIFLDSPYKRFHWKWGIPRGGTPAKLVDKEYLAFFHSSFGNKRWYVMGAYTFEASPPFCVTKVSAYPIIFKELKKNRIIFPSGFIERDGKFYVAYGENDHNIKIVILDKQKLLASLRPM